MEGVKTALTELGAQVTPVEDQGFGRTSDARDPGGHDLVAYSPNPENR